MSYVVPVESKVDISPSQNIWTLLIIPDLGGDKKVIQYEKSKIFCINFNMNCFEKLKLGINYLLTRISSNKGFFCAIISAQ